MDAVHDADAEGHEWLGEVNDLFTLCCDGEAGHGEVSFLQHGNTESETMTHAEHVT